MWHMCLLESQGLQIPTFRTCIISTPTTSSSQPKVSFPTYPLFKAIISSSCCSRRNKLLNHWSLLWAWGKVTSCHVFGNSELIWTPATCLNYRRQNERSPTPWQQQWDQAAKALGMQMEVKCKLLSPIPSWADQLSWQWAEAAFPPSPTPHSKVPIFWEEKSPAELQVFQ